ncbi:hypothetical protein [Luteibaculum oceani]|uniref:DUF2490 domain-containing protein n=1 Tax=Luteibaculum oceani TaxID=1294296 RepID=A0A5C6UT11_9FLAO|nr:hypothetical protein [Luteibaculum oceani]TXC76119.1 hypothetical protein FRX97_11445 [Luteibaculum oceani]
MKLIKLVFILISFLFLDPLFGQDNSRSQNTYWNTVLLSKKLNNRFSASNLNIYSIRASTNKKWFNYHDFSVAYKLDRFWSVSMGIAISSYKLSSGGNKNFVTQTAMISRSFRLGKIGLLTRVIAQNNNPKFSRYQQRFQLVIRSYYRKGNLPLKIKPYMQTALYYYLNGKERTYYDDNFQAIGKKSPDGIHRIRFKAGFMLNPIRNLNPLKVGMYIARNVEFNLPWGNELNFPRNSSGTRISLPFNNYNLIGLQVNYSL